MRGAVFYSRNVRQVGLFIAFDVRELNSELGWPKNLHRLQ